MQGGEVTCSPLGIQCNTRCSHPFNPPDQCCPVCDDCEFQNRRINNGQQFRHPTDICQICECRVSWIEEKLLVKTVDHIHKLSKCLTSLLLGS